MKEINKEFARISRAIAEKRAAEVEMKNGFMESKEQFIERNSSSVAKSLENNYAGLCKQMEELSKVIQEHLVKADNKIKHIIEKDFVAMQKALENADLSEPLQKVAKINPTTMKWLYTIGYELFQKKNFPLASSFFLLLTMLNPVMAEYWMALGSSLKQENRVLDALRCFSFVSLIDAKHPRARYECAKLYIDDHKTAEALAEIALLEKIIEENHLHDMKPKCAQLKQTALARKKH